MHQNRFLSAVAFVLGCCLSMTGFGLACLAASDESAIAVTDVQLGIAGQCKLGCWMPASVTVECRDRISLRLVVTATDPDGSTVRYPGPVQDLAAGTHRLSTEFRFGRLEPLVRVLVEDPDGRLFLSRSIRLDDARAGDGESAAPVTIGQSTQLILTVGRPAGFASLEDATAGDSTEPDESARAFRVIALDSVDELPTRVLAMDSIDVIVLSGQFDVGLEQSLSLRRWVEQGGHLMIAAGTTAEAWLSSPLSEWVSIQLLTETRSIRELSGIETLAGNRGRLSLFRPIDVPVLRSRSGQVLVPGPDHPIVVRASHGFGRITFSAIDFHLPPLSDWEPFSNVCRSLVGNDRADEQLSRSESRRNRISRSGITDLATQLNATQEQFDAVNRRSGWTVMTYLFAYLLVVGPLDWLIVRKLLNRPHLTWVTLPILIIAVSVLAVSSASRDNGGKMHVNQLDMLDLDAATGTVTLRDWTTIYSPETRRYQVGLQQSREMQWAGDDADSVGWMSWFGLPESTYGGMYRPGGFEFGRPGYSTAADRRQFDNLPMSIWSTRGLTAQWSNRSRKPLVTGELQGLGTGQLSGQFFHDLPVPITDWVLAFGNRIYLPDRPLTPGLPFPPNSWERVSQRELRGYLTDTTTRRIESEVSGIGDSFRTEQTAYDPMNRDLDKIMEMLTFHEAAGGPAYTGLENQSYPDCDLSTTLKLNRAILLGRIDLSAVDLVIDGQSVEPDRRATFVRIQIPVQPSDNDLQELPDFKNGNTSP